MLWYVSLLPPFSHTADMLQLNDGASSIASFEDVGGEHSKDSSADKKLAIRDPRFKTKGTTMSETVPDVKYVLQYKSLTGNVVECKCILYPSAKY